MNTMMNRYLKRVLLFLACAPGLGLAQEIGDPGCPQLMLVSSFGGNNVRIYNACDGSFVRNLDSNGYLEGPQAIALDPGGDLVVVSEGNGRLVRYHRESLTYDRVIMGDRPETPGLEPLVVPSPTGLVIAPNGRMFVGSYSGQYVSEVDSVTGQAIANIVSTQRSGIEGPDTGMILHQNRLIVPGFDSSTVVAADITMADSDQVLVSAGLGGLSAPRTILRKSDGNLLVTSWRGNAVLEYDGDTGAFVGSVISVQRPTGMAFESENTLLVASDRNNDVRRYRVSDGELLDTVITGIDGPTFILLLEKQASRLADNNAFWLVGVGELADKSIHVDKLHMTLGGRFGSALDPADIENVHWGSLDIEFGSCDDALVSWAALEAGFESADFPITRLASDPFGAECLEAGFGDIDHDLWMNGLWYGGPERDGEGFSVNIIGNGSAVIAWYTYRP